MLSFIRNYFSSNQKRIKYYFILDWGKVEFWLERDYSENEQDQVVLLALDSSRNYYFRQAGVIAFAGIDSVDNSQIFYVVLNK